MPEAAVSSVTRCCCLRCRKKRKLARTCCGGFLDPVEEENMLKSSIPDVVPHSSVQSTLRFEFLNVFPGLEFRSMPAIESRQVPASRVIELGSTRLRSWCLWQPECRALKTASTDSAESGATNLTSTPNPPLLFYSFLLLTNLSSAHWKKSFHTNSFHVPP